MMALSKIRIEGSGQQGRQFKIFLDGIDISHQINRATFVWDANDINQVILEFIAGEVEVPEEFEAQVYKRKSPGLVEEYVEEVLIG